MRRSRTSTNTAILPVLLAICATATASSACAQANSAAQPITDGAMRENALPGIDGIEQLISLGFLRRVSLDDINGWAGKNGKLRMIGGPSMEHPEIDMLQRVGESTSAYLILKPISRVPSGLTGSMAVIFILPEGIQPPAMTDTHSSFYALEGYQGIPAAGSPVPLDDFMQRARTSSLAGQERGIRMPDRPYRGRDGVDDRPESMPRWVLPTIATVLILAISAGIFAWIGSRRRR